MTMTNADTAEALLKALRDLGDEYGPMGVALAAAGLTDIGVLRGYLADTGIGPDSMDYRAVIRAVLRDDVEKVGAPARLRVLAMALDDDRLLASWGVPMEEGQFRHADLASAEKLGLAKRDATLIDGRARVAWALDWPTLPTPGGYESDDGPLDDASQSGVLPAGASLPAGVRAAAADAGIPDS